MVKVALDVPASTVTLELGALRERMVNQAQVSGRRRRPWRISAVRPRLEGTRPTAGGGRGGADAGSGRRAGRSTGGVAPAAVSPRAGGGLGASPAASTDTLWSTTATLSGMMNAMQAADVSPTTNTLTAVTAAQASAAKVMARWRALKTIDLPALNLKLEAAGAQPLTLK
jgi:hypothetical protein